MDISILFINGKVVGVFSNDNALEDMKASLIAEGYEESSMSVESHEVIDNF